MRAPYPRYTAVLCVSAALLIGLQALPGLPASASASPDALITLVTRLVELRAEVEGLFDSIQAQKSQAQALTRSHAGQKAELEAQIQREELRLKQLEAHKKKHLERVAQGKAARKSLAPAILKSIARVRTRIQASLPFKKAERLGELDTIERTLKEGMLRPQKAAARLWQFTMDELRLTRENGLYAQILPIEGKEVLCDVVRLGMVAMYFKTQDGRVGRVGRVSQEHKKTGADVWSYEVLTDESSRAETLVLFERFKKNIRTGFFVLPHPNPIPAR